MTTLSTFRTPIWHTWWCHDIETPSTLLAFCDGIHRKMRSVDDFVNVIALKCSPRVELPVIWDIMIWPLCHAIVMQKPSTEEFITVTSHTVAASQKLTTRCLFSILFNLITKKHLSPEWRYHVLVSFDYFRIFVCALRQLADWPMKIDELLFIWRHCIALSMLNLTEALWRLCVCLLTMSLLLQESTPSAKCRPFVLVPIYQIRLASNPIWTTDVMSTKLSWKSDAKYNHFHSRKCIWKYRLHNIGHLVQISIF